LVTGENRYSTGFSLRVIVDRRWLGLNFVLPIRLPDSEQLTPTHAVAVSVGVWARAASEAPTIAETSTMTAATLSSCPPVHRQ